MVARTCIKDGATVEIRLSEPAPVADAPDSAWHVTLTSWGLDRNFVQPIHGFDGVQALELATQILSTIEEVAGLELPGSGTTSRGSGLADDSLDVTARASSVKGIANRDDTHVQPLSPLRVSCGGNSPGLCPAGHPARC